MVYKKVTTLRQGRKFNAEVQTMVISNKRGQYKKFNTQIQVLDRNKRRIPEGALLSEVVATRCLAPRVWGWPRKENGGEPHKVDTTLLSGGTITQQRRSTDLYRGTNDAHLKGHYPVK